MWTFSRAPTLASPEMLLINGFHSGKASKSVKTCHTPSADDSITISLRSCLKGTL